MNLKELLSKAKKLQTNAYVPYSHFRVAAIVILKNGQEITGVNVENAAFPATICAERTALAQVITLGYQKTDIEALFLITDSISLGSPCGICRQFMIEIMPLTAKVFISNCNSKDDKDLKIIKVQDLLPFAFMPESLKGNKK
ncbi:MAG: cytidine deaminase [Spiroplasma sp.]|nr:cytidine deaminase [Spiroplasma sp.]